MVRNASSSRTQFLPKRPRQLRIGCEKVLTFIIVGNLPSGSADLNPLDYKLWAVLQDMACRERHNNLESLRRSLVKGAAESPPESERVATAEWPERLELKLLQIIFLFLLLRRACCRVTQLLHQPLHIYKIY